MKNYQKNSRNPSVPFTCMFEQCLSSVLDKTNKGHLNNHIWSWNLNLVFKPTSFKSQLDALAQIITLLPCHIHASYCCICIDCVLLYCRCLSRFSRRRSNDVIDDTDEELQYLQKCQASKNPLFIPIQSHSLAPALFYCIRTTTTYLLLAAVAEPLYPLHDLSFRSNQMKPTSMSRNCLSPDVPTHSCLLSCLLLLRVESGLIHRE